MALTQLKSGAIADDSVTLAELAAGTDGQIITYDASGNPVAVGPGTDGQVLTSTGAGSPPAFEAVPAGGATINNATENEIVTVASTTSQLDAESALTFDGTKVVLGGQTARAIDGYQGTFQIEGTGDTTTSMSIVRNSNDNHPPSLNFGKSKAGANGGSTIVADATNLGQITFYAADGTDMECEGARIEATSWGSQASNNTPTALTFRTNSGGTGTNVVGRFSPNGNFEVEDGDITISTAGHGIKFSATSDGPSMSSEIFDDYEEGTWTPTFTSSGGGSVTSYGGQTGWYIKVGRMVHAMYRMRANSMSGMSGLDLLKLIRADSDLKHIPVLMVTSEDLQGNIITAIKAGLNDYIVRPFEEYTFKQKLEKIFV